VPGPVLPLRTDVEDDHAPVAQAPQQLGGVHGLKRVPVPQVGLQDTVDLGETRLREGADGLPRPEHVLVCESVVHVDTLAARLDHPGRLERLEVLRRAGHGHRRLSGDLLDRTFALCQEVHYLKPPGAR
jgi:hypothetical protein